MELVLGHVFFFETPRFCLAILPMRADMLSCEHGASFPCPRLMGTSAKVNLFFYITDSAASPFNGGDTTQGSTCPFWESRLIPRKQTDKKFLLRKNSSPETIECLSGPRSRSRVSDISCKKFNVQRVEEESVHQTINQSPRLKPADL